MTIPIAKRFREHRAYLYIVGVAIVLIGFVVAGRFARATLGLRYGAAGTIDLIAYWGGGRLLWSGENPYDLDKLGALQLEVSRHPLGCVPGCPHPPFPVIMYNPPWLSVWLAPVVALPFPAAAVAWLGLNLALILSAATLLWRLFAEHAASTPVAFNWIASVVFLPVLSNLQMGQMGGLLVFGLAGFVFFTSRGRDFPAGMCLALTTIKPHVVYLPWIAIVCWVVLERRWRVFAGVAAVLLPSLGVVALVSSRALVGYQSILANPPLHLRTPTLGGVSRLLLFHDAPRIQYLPALMAGSALAVYLLSKRPHIDWKAAMGPLLLVSVTTAAYGWSYDQVVLLVPFLEVVNRVLGDQKVDRSRTRLLISIIVIVAVAMVVQNRSNVSDDAYFWAPWAMGGIYYLALLSPGATPRTTGAAIVGRV